MTAVDSSDGELRMELRALRLGAGATPERIVASGELHRRLGLPPLADAAAVLIACVGRLGPTVEASALASALGLDVADGHDRRLVGRRTAFARRSGLLPDAIERHEATAINQLVDLLGGGRA